MHPTLASGAIGGRKDRRARLLALRRTRQGRLALYAISIGLVAVAYSLAGRVGLKLAYLNGAVAALWPPAGLGLAVLFLWGLRLCPGGGLAALWLGNCSSPCATVLGETAGNTLALVVAALLLRRLTGGRGEL